MIPLAYHVTKSKAAFLMSCEKLFQAFPNSVYFWTFTFKDVHPDWWYPIRWHEFMNDMARTFGGGTPQGIRVIEVHPGGHGLHYHALLVKRLNWRIVRHVAKRHDIGVLWVKKAKPELAMYLAKYLSKENDLTPGMRKWACMGRFGGTPVKRVEIDSVLTRNIKWVQNYMEGQQFSHAFFLHLSKMSMLYGEIADWPEVQINTAKYPPNWKVKRVREVVPPPRMMAVDTVRGMQLRKMPEKEWAGTVDYVLNPNPF
jgi:hypothetical protein